MYNCSMFNLLFIVDGNEDVFIDKMISLSHVEHKKMFSTKINQRRYNFFYECYHLQVCKLLLCFLP